MIRAYDRYTIAYYNMQHVCIYIYTHTHTRTHTRTHARTRAHARTHTHTHTHTGMHAHNIRIHSCAQTKRNSDQCE